MDGGVSRPWTIVVAVAATAAVAVFFLGAGPSPAPGFIRDEASISYNAYTIGHSFRDQNGGLAPLYIKSFDDYKSPLFVYALAGVFRVTGASDTVARTTAAVFVFAAVLLLGLLAWWITRSLAVVVTTIVLAALTPWLYELGRDAYDTSSEPLLIVLVLLALWWATHSARSAFVRALPLGLALGGLSYSYAAGRLLSPLWIVGLTAVYAARSRWRWLGWTWAVYVVSMLPLVVYSFVHTGALTARYQSTTFIQDGMSTGTIVSRFVGNYLRDGNLWFWLVSGDSKPYIRVAGVPQLYVVTVLLAVAGVVIVWLRQRSERFWWFVLVALVLSIAPAALTEDRHYSLRLLPIPTLLTVLAIPAVDALWQSAVRDWPARFAAAALVLVLALQVGQFVSNHDKNNGGRAVVFERDVPSLLERAFARNSGPVYIDHDDIYAQTHALWYAVSHDIPRDRVSILPDGGVPPNDATVFGRLQSCDYTCPHLADADTYWVARAKTG